MKTIIFDFDGTLADTNACILATFKASFDQLGLPCPSDETITSLIGLPLDEMFVRFTQSTDKDLIDECVATYHRLFPTAAFYSASLFEGVATTLRELKQRGYVLTIATSRSNGSLLMLTERLGIQDLFSMMVCLEDVENKKPAPDMVLKILEATDTRAEEALVVGDTVFDIEMGQGAGCKTCGVSYGNQTRQQLEEQHPDIIVDKFEELIDKIG